MNATRNGATAYGFSYDGASDVLYLWLGAAPQPAFSEPAAHDNDSILLRYALATDELVGVTVVGYSQVPDASLGMLPVHVDWTSVRDRVFRDA